MGSITGDTGNYAFSESVTGCSLMSSNIREVRDELQELRSEMRDVRIESRAYTSALLSGLNLARRMGLPDHMRDQITGIQRMIRMLNALKATYHAVMVARMAAGDPLAWIQAGIAVGTVAMDIGTEVYSR